MMFDWLKWKHMAAVHAAEAEFDDYPRGPMEPFDFNAIEDRSIVGRLKSRGSALFLLIAIPLSRAFFPVLRLGRFVILSRYAQVVEALGNDSDFNTPFGPEMKGLSRGATFVLGLDGEPRRPKRALLEAIVQRDRDKAMLTDLAARLSEGLLENAAGRIDAIQDLIKRVSAEAAARYCGLWVEDADAFADWAMSTSTLIFADPLGDARARDVALNGAARLRAVIDDGIDRSRRNTNRGDETIVDRLVTLQVEGTDGAPNDAEIRAMLFGLITGFVPTNTLAGAKILSELLARPSAFDQAREAAVAGQRPALSSILLECARLSPALAPGQFRYCPREASVAVGTRRVTIPADSVVLVSTMSAMRDHRAFPSPRRFWPERTRSIAEPDLVFGWGVHACIGRHFAMAQLTEIFTALLTRPGLRVNGGMDIVSGFPRHQVMTFDTPLERQSMFLVVAQAYGEAAKAALDAAIAPLGHPATDPIRDALHATKIVHFASLSTVQTGKGEMARIDLIFELSFDGPVSGAIDAIVKQAGPLLQPVFAQVGNEDVSRLADFLRAHVVDLHAAPWGATGLNFAGTQGLSVRTIERQEQLARIAGEALEKHLGRYAQSGSRAMNALTYVRRIIADDRFQRLLTSRTTERSLSEEARKANLDAFVLKPKAQMLDIAKWREPSYYNSPWKALFSPVGVPFVLGVLLVWAVLSKWVGLFLHWPPLVAGRCGIGRLADLGACNWGSLGIYLWSFLLSISGGLLAVAALVTALVVPAILILRWKETSDVPDTLAPELSHMATIARYENHQGFAQNHVMAVGTLKPGLFRKIVHAAALFGIGRYLAAFFRPGFIVNFGTIHFARWWRLPGTDRVIFFSNYDGSWESYLEDFITRAFLGQTAAWSNWQGFPKTRFLVFDGARNGDAFKQWVRRQQVPAPFWYSRFPHMTTDEMRNNALIHHGLARASNDSEARDWLRCFGSVPRTANMIETDEVQSIVFSGLGRFRHAAALFVTLPPEPKRYAKWQRLLNGQVYVHPADKAMDPPPPGFVEGGRPLPPEMLIGFGNKDSSGRLGEKGTTIFALSAVGLAVAGRWQGASSAAGSDIPDRFPAVFRMGMAARPEVLGDYDAADPANWRWSDAAQKKDGTTARPVEAMLYLFAKTEDACEQLIRDHRDLLIWSGGSVLDMTKSAIPQVEGVDDGFGFEHFGFRDGISQPVIRGTGKAGRSVPERDIVEPGEFILGYSNNQGYFPPSPLVRDEYDYQHDLPAVHTGDLSRFPDFGATSRAGSFRDFGRNGTYLVVRELAQDVNGFRDFVTTKARSVAVSFRQLDRVVNHPVNGDWIAAKLIGRWPDGRPLALFPTQSDGRPSPVPTDEERANDFAYGIVDPQGVACPFGSHIRRANPRDSKSPGDADEQVITNRHRLLRRGRSYEKTDPETGIVEKGLLFVAACGDIERQFEFVQQTWINSPKFHGLSNEPDPLIGANDPGFPDRSFTIPTAAGSIQLGSMQAYVTVRAGGYFFAPSRSALIYLARLAERASAATH